MSRYKDMKEQCIAKINELNLFFDLLYHTKSVERPYQIIAFEVMEVLSSNYEERKKNAFLNDKYMERKLQPYIQKIGSEYYIPKKSCSELIHSIIREYQEYLFTEKEAIEPFIPGDSLFKLIDTIISDLHYENKLDALLTKEPPETAPKDWDDKCDQFLSALNKLREFWNKTKGSNLLTDDDDLMAIFQIIYERYPVLCREAFPAVLFIFADSFYEFRNLYNSEKKEEIIDLFKTKIGGDEFDNYLFSLIDVKHNNYSESTLSQGEVIFNNVLKKGREFMENAKLPFNLSQLSEDLYEFIYSTIKTIHEQKKKKSEIPIGENFNAIWHFIQIFQEEDQDNCWSEYDIPFSLFVLNQATMWVNCSILSASGNPVDQDDAFYLNRIPATLFYTSSYLHKFFGKDSRKKKKKLLHIKIVRLFEILETDMCDEKYSFKSEEEGEYAEIDFNVTDYYTEIMQFGYPFSTTAIYSILAQYAYFTLQDEYDDILPLE